jgi:MoxR-like ATPase
MDIKELNEKAAYYSAHIQKIITQVKKVIVGQDDTVNKMMISLIADGHILLEGVPGLAKTMMIKTLSDALHSEFHRIQFTPDLLPADIIGTTIYNHKEGTFKTRKGPVFANFILADEINRAPPKVQSALLEAMQERQVTISGETHKLKDPFLVLATQNPIESEGTYRLPEAQVDRFMFKLIINYPTKEEEKEIIRRMTQGHKIEVEKVMAPAMIKKIQEFNTQIYADEKIEDYTAEIIDATRYPEKYGIEVKDLIDFGASPRATIWLILAAKANALMNSRGYVIPEDIQEIAYDVLRHRIILSYEAEAEGITSDAIIEKILAKIKVP